MRSSIRRLSGGTLLTKEQEQKNEINWFSVDGVEIHRLLQTNQDAERFFNSFNTGMWNSNPRTGTGGPKLLTRRELTENPICRQFKGICGSIGQLLEQATLVGRTYIDQDVSRRQEAFEVHCCIYGS
jgi:hypothetical protein